MPDNKDKVSFSLKNTKMGKVLSVSLPPGLSCGEGVPCFKGCYAAKLSRLRPSVRDAWARNWRLAVADRDSFFTQVIERLSAKPPDMFRWHVSGDFPDYDYLSRAAAAARAFGGVKFMAFTKKYDLLRLMHRKKLERPSNFSIVASGWPGLYMPPDIRRKHPVAWMRDPGNPDRRIDARARECPGNCETCGLCWGLAAGESVVFDKH